MDRREIGSLTGIRGVAALTVTLYHLAYLNDLQPIAGYVFPGYLAVDLFFCLSGFVISLAYAREFEKGFSGRRFRVFLERRFARIYPVYILLVVIKLAAYGSLGIEQFPAATIIANVFLVQFWGIGHFVPSAGVTLFGPSWSISTELFVYLVFPALVAAVIRLTPIRMALAYSICIALLCVVSVRAPGLRGPLDSNDGTTLYPLIRCCAGFVTGMLAWRVSRHPTLIQTAGRWLDVLLCAVLGGLLATSGADVIFAALLPVLIIRLCAPSSLLASAMNTRAAIFIGEISYSLYLIQNSTTALLQNRITHVLAAHSVPWPMLVASVALLALDLVLATLLFFNVEKPARWWLRRLFEGKAPPPILSEPAAP